MAVAVVERVQQKFRGMRYKSKNEDRIWDDTLLMPGFWINIFRQERDLLILADGLRDSFKIDGGMLYEKRKIISYRR